MKRILILVEDPGAANFIIGLPEILKECGCDTLIFGVGAAQAYLVDRGVMALSADNLEQLESIIEKFLIDTVVIGTSENRCSLGLSLIEKARSRSIRSIGIVDAIMNAEARFQGETNDALAYLPDIIVVADAKTKNCYMELGVQFERILVIGNPQVDMARSRALEYSALDRNKERIRHFGVSDTKRPIVAFLSEISDGLEPQDFIQSDQYCIKGRGQSKQRTHIVLEEFLDAMAELCPEALVVMRIHPKERKCYYNAYKHEIGQWSDGSDPLSVLYAVDLVVGMTTSLLLECHVMGVPVLSILPREQEKYWLPDSETHKITIALGRTAIRQQLRKAIYQKPKRLVNQVEPVIRAVEKFSDIILGLPRVKP